MLRGAGAWRKADQLAEATEVAKGTLHDHLKHLHGVERVSRRGKGRQGDPYLWALPEFDSSDAISYTDETNSEEDSRDGGPPEDWTSEAAEAFIKRAKEVFPGSAELDGGQDV